MKNSKLVAVLVFIATVSLSICKAQNKLDGSVLNATPEAINQDQSEAVWMGLLKSCANTQAMREELSSACLAVFEAGWRGQKWKPQNVAEAYLTYVKGDKSLEEARANEFTLRRARASIEAKQEEALKAIEAFDLSGSHHYIKMNLDPSKYDFDKAVYPLVLEGSYPSPTITLKGRMGGAHLFPSENVTDRGFEVAIPLSEDKASSLFGSESKLPVIVDVKFDNFIEIGSPSRTYAGAVVTRIDIYHGKTGNLLLSYDL